MKKISLVIVLVFVLITVSVFGQDVTHSYSRKSGTQINYRGFSMRNIRWEIGFSLGVANSMTDIAAGKAGKQASLTDVYARGFSPAGLLSLRYRFHDNFALRWNTGAIMLRANDQWSADINIINRRKSYSNTLFEGSLLAEFYLPQGNVRPKADFSQNTRDLLFFTGVAVFYHSPDVNGPIIDDFDRNLLGADYLYSNVQLAIPIGAGIQWTIENRWVVGFEANFRYTFFDYLDGFKRPYANRDDFYFTTGITLGYIFKSRVNEIWTPNPRHALRRRPY